MILSDLIAYFVEPLAAILLQLLAILDPLGTVLSQRSLSGAWTFTHARSLTHAGAFADACAWTLASRGQG